MKTHLNKIPRRFLSKDLPKKNFTDIYISGKTIEANVYLPQWHARDAYMIAAQLAIAFGCVYYGKTKKQLGEVVERHSQRKSPHPLQGTQRMTVSITLEQKMQYTFGKIAYEIENTRWQGTIEYAIVPQISKLEQNLMNIFTPIDTIYNKKIKHILGTHSMYDPSLNKTDDTSWKGIYNTIYKAKVKRTYDLKKAYETYGYLPSKYKHASRTLCGHMRRTIAKRAYKKECGE